MVSVRNPLAGFGITILGTVALSFLVGIPLLFLPRGIGEARPQADRASHGPCPEDAPMSQVRREGRHVGPQVLVLSVVSPAHVGGRIRFSSSDRGSARR